MRHSFCMSTRLAAPYWTQVDFEFPLPALHSSTGSAFLQAVALMLRAAPPPLRRLSLRGQLFLLVGFPRQERARLAEELARAQATLLPPEGQEEEAAGLSVLFVVANYWTDAAAPTEARAVRSWRESRRQRAGDARVEVVTRFWVLEMARVGHWIDPRLDLFFRPPPPPPTDASAGSRSASATLLLTYPVNYRDGADMEMLDAAGSAGASGQGQTKRLARLRLPCSPRHLFEGEVPLWPYVFGFLRQPLRNMRDLDALLRACVDRRPLDSKVSQTADDRVATIHLAGCPGLMATAGSTALRRPSSR